MKTFLKVIILCSFCFLIMSLQKEKKLTENQKLAYFFAKENVRIIVTDSGLGGLSVAADVYERLKLHKIFKSAEVIFFNAQPHLESGYNSMKTTEQKVNVFNNALYAMEKEFHTDAILIACNTLSVIYNYTSFSESTEIPVKGIVGTGIDLIKREMDQSIDSKVIIFATETTIMENKHKMDLIEKGISENRIFTQACPKLAGQIERDPQADTTHALVRKYVKEALNKVLPIESVLLVSYNCTHYGYIDDLFQKTFKGKNIQVKKYLNPNPLMADFLFNENNLKRFGDAKVNIRVVSQSELTPGKQATVFGFIESHSPETANALLEYRFVPDFFEWRSIMNAIPEQ